MDFSYFYRFVIIVPGLTMKHLEIITKNMKGYKVWKEEKQKCFYHIAGKMRK